VLSVTDLPESILAAAQSVKETMKYQSKDEGREQRFREFATQKQFITTTRFCRVEEAPIRDSDFSSIINYRSDDRCPIMNGKSLIGEFGMTDSLPFTPSQFCPGADILSQGFERMHNVIDNRSFTFLINGEAIVSDFLEAIILSPFVGEQLQSDRLSTLFSISDTSINGGTFEQLRHLLSGSSIAISRGLRGQLISLSRFLGNRELAKLFLGLSFNSSVSDPQST
jgi:hypothetical protein